MSLHGASSGDAGALACFGVFDGHGGVEAAQYASQCLLARVADEVTNDEGEPPSDKLIASAFASVDDEVWAQPGHCSGTTAVCAFAGAPSANGSAHVAVGSVGDSGACALVPTPTVDTVILRAEMPRPQGAFRVRTALVTAL